MATLGKSTTPTSSTHGWINAAGYAVGMLFTVPAGGGIFTSVTFWAAGTGGNVVGLRGTIWDTSGNVLGSAPAVTTTGGQNSSPGGSGQWYTGTLGSSVFIAGGTQIYIGWQPNNNLGVSWAYNGGDHSPDTEWDSGHYGATSNFVGHVTESPNGAVAAYATYTPVSAPSVSSFSPSVGPAGTSVTVNGSQFSLASAVYFNGVSASFTVVSDTQITATVPSGATTGPISVVNPDGTGNSATNFIVGSVYGDDGSNFITGATVWADDGAAWHGSTETWADNGTSWVRVL